MSKSLISKAEQPSSNSQLSDDAGKTWLTPAQRVGRIIGDITWVMSEMDQRHNAYRIMEGVRQSLHVLKSSLALEPPAVTDEKGRPMTYWGGPVQPPDAVETLRRIYWACTGKGEEMDLGKLQDLTRPFAGTPPTKCSGCNGRGEVGGLTPNGYESEPCPFCTPQGESDAQ
jgi:hypothetical protein